MARGLTREQLGITDAMLASYGEAVFRMSHNLQVREGDPIRRLDWTEIGRQQEAMGLNDVQIAARLGITREQAMFIRNSEESRRFRTGQTAYLLDLGGGKRYRPERVVRLEERFRYSEKALRLRAAFRFDPERARLYVERGWWNGDTLPDWLARHAAERPGAPALVRGEEVISWGELARRVACVAEGLRRAGVARGEVVAVRSEDVVESVIAYAAICRLAAVAGVSAEHSLTFAELDASTPIAKDYPGPVAADPCLLLGERGSIPHNYHTALSVARLGAADRKLGASDRVSLRDPLTHWRGLYALHTGWVVGAALVLDTPDTENAIEQLWGADELHGGVYLRPGPDDPARIGRTVPGTEIRLGERGELEVRGCGLFPGYLDDEGARRKAFTDDGWFRTGQTAMRD